MTPIDFKVISDPQCTYNVERALYIEDLTTVITSTGSINQSINQCAKHQSDFNGMGLL